MSVIATILEFLPFSEREVASLIRTAPSRYKVHLIEKRNNRGNRIIAQPTAEIKAIQRVLVQEYISKLPVSSAAKAYRKGMGIRDHASIHAKNRYLLKLDFKDFFPSIYGADFLKHLKKHSDLSPDDAKLMVRLLFWRPTGERKLRLSIGAPSSPSISNTILFDFDSAISKYCEGVGVVYTRYADDLAFSTSQPNVLKDVADAVSSLCSTLRYPKLTLNQDKTVYTSKKNRRQLTGLILSNDGIASLGREKKRLIRSMVNRYEKGELSLDQKEILRGWLAFATSVDAKYIESLKRMVGEVAFKRLMEF